MITKGALGGLVFITDDARALYDTLRERGVTDFTQEPTEHFYGIDMGVRDPFGNPIRILQQGRSPTSTAGGSSGWQPGTALLSAAGSTVSGLEGRTAPPRHRSPRHEVDVVQHG